MALTFAQIRAYIDANYFANGLNQITGPVGNTALNEIVNLIEANILQGLTSLSWKDPVKAATTANITLSGTQTIDGIALIAGDRVLVKNQSSGANNGIYVVAAGAWSRATDANTSNLITFATVPVESGTINHDKVFVMTTDSPNLGTTVLSFSDFTIVVAVATDTVRGIAKLYDTLGTSTDGAATRNLVRNVFLALSAAVGDGNLPFWDNSSGTYMDSEIAPEDIVLSVQGPQVDNSDPQNPTIPYINGLVLMATKIGINAQAVAPTDLDFEDGIDLSSHIPYLTVIEFNTLPTGLDNMAALEVYLSANHVQITDQKAVITMMATKPYMFIYTRSMPISSTGDLSLQVAVVSGGAGALINAYVYGLPTLN